MLNLIKNSINPKDFLGIILLISIIALLTIVALVLLKMTEIAQNVVKSALLILGLFGVIIAVTLAAIGLGMLAIQASPVLGMAAGGLALICVTILILTVMAVLLKKLESITLNPDKIKENVETVIGTAKLVINSIFTSSDKEGQDSKESWLGSVLSAVGGMVATLAKSILAIRFLALSIVSIFMVLVLATLLRLIQELNLDPSKIQENVRIVIDTALLVIDTLFKRPDTEANKSDKNWIVSVIETFGGPIVSIIKAIIAIRFLAISIVAILFINILSVQLRLLQALNLDPSKIQENVRIVIDTALLVTDSLFKRPDSDGEQSNKNWIVSLIEYIGGPIVKIAQAIIAIRFLAISIASIFLVMILAKQLEQLSKINIDDNIKVKVDSILIAADQVRISLINRKSTLESNNTDTEKQGLLSRFFPKLSNATRLIASMTWLSAALVSVGMVSELAKQLEIINKLPDTSNTLNNVNILCNTADNIINKLTGNIKLPRRNNKLKLIEQFIEITNNIKPRKVKSTVKLFESSINFVDKINTVDVKKLETSTRMFEQMAKFSSSIQGDFNKLAETLNENLMPVLEELKNIMGQIPEKLDTGFQNTSASIAATTTTQNASTVAAQVKRESPNISPEQQNIEVQRRLNAYNAAEANGMISKIDEMLNLLKGYSGYVKVKTV